MRAALPPVMAARCAAVRKSPRRQPFDRMPQPHVRRKIRTEKNAVGADPLDQFRQPGIAVADAVVVEAAQIVRRSLLGVLPDIAAQCVGVIEATNGKRQIAAGMREANRQVGQPIEHATKNQRSGERLWFQAGYRSD